jgi:hypothetical protein
MTAQEIIDEIQKSQQRRVLIRWKSDRPITIEGESWYVGLTNSKPEDKYAINFKAKNGISHRLIFPVDSMDEGIKVCRDLFRIKEGDLNSIVPDKHLIRHSDMYIEIFVKYHTN